MGNKVQRSRILCGVIVGSLLLLAALFGLAQPAQAQQPAINDFAVDVTPSPIFTTLKPGTTTSLDLKIRNAGTSVEEYKIEPRSFTIGDQGQIVVSDTQQPEIAQWISFKSPKFTIRPGEWYDQAVRIALPKDTGFSYSFVLMISRSKGPDPKTVSGRAIAGSLAIFSLINVDRPGATRKLEVEKFESAKDSYEYLPATLKVHFKNTGNTIVQPYGNVFIQRGKDDSTPLANLPVNGKKGYIIPGSTRIIEPQWKNGFPHFESNADGTIKTNEVWDFSKISDLRIGPYTAKLVAAYNDGQRDVTLERETTFWVFPWKIVLGIAIVVLVFGLGVWSVLHKIWKLARGNKHRGMRM